MCRPSGEAPVSLEHLALQSGYRVGELCRILDVSAPYFREVFTRDLGVSPKDWMRWESMAAARRLLLQDRPVETISRILGFADLNSFRREFREVHQVTLTSFRQSRGFGVV